MNENRDNIVCLWAKTAKNNAERWHPLLLHLLDVAASSDMILAREPETTRLRMAAIFGMVWKAARPWILLVIASHDLGKACPGFQCKQPDLLGGLNLWIPPSPNTNINHAFVSQIVLMDLLREKQWPDDLSEWVAAAVGCHHGERASPRLLDRLAGDERAMGRKDWEQTRRALLENLIEVFNPVEIPVKPSLSGSDFMLLSGLTSFADWIGSNEDWFPYGTPGDCRELEGWFQKRRNCAEKALDAIGWAPRTPLAIKAKTFSEVFGFSPRPLQQAIVDVLPDLKKPSILLVEAPMGEGKTEAAFFAHLELQRCFGHRGLYIALPTKATGNAMFTRTINFLQSQGADRKLDLQLVHGVAILNDSFQNLRFSGIHDPASGGEIKAGEWFTNKKRALLSEYGVGTVDQALLPILPVRHQFVRLWGLANRVVIFDEIHAYDAYTGTLLIHLLRWLLALGSSVILLSATLSPSVRRKLADIVDTGFPDREKPYPRISVFCPGSEINQIHCLPDPARRRVIRMIGIPPSLSNLYDTVNEHFGKEGMGLVLFNTVQRAQDLYQLFPDGEVLEYESGRVGKRLPDGTEVFLFHARFPADQRQKRENCVLEMFGENGPRSGRKILIATQVAEQSLDLDFDWMVSDLAPIDLILQRAGRLWRHARAARPMKEPILIVAGLSEDEPPLFGEPLWWGAVYREDILLRTWSLIKDRQNLTLPDDIDAFVQAVYEEQIDLPGHLRERLERALMTGEGEAIVKRGQADQAIIGLPDDASWKDSSRFVLFDEDEPNVHRTLMAHTRMDQDSVLAVPLWLEDKFDSDAALDFAQAKQWYLRTISLSRKAVVMRLKHLGIPKGWKKSSLLRNCFPLELDDQDHWMEDTSVRLDKNLGLVYEPKEAE